MADYFSKVAWGTIAKNVLPYTYQNTFQLNQYKVDVYPLDRNEPGADDFDVEVGDYFIDFLGYPWEVEQLLGLPATRTLIVKDINERSVSESINYGPYPGKIGYVYRPTKGAIILAQAQLIKLDSQARDRINNIEKGVLWDNVNSGFAYNTVLGMQSDNTLDPGLEPDFGDNYIILDSANLHANFGTIVDIADNDIVEYDDTEFVIVFDASGEDRSVTVTVTTDSDDETAEMWSFDIITQEWIDVKTDINYWTKSNTNLTYLNNVGIGGDANHLFKLSLTGDMGMLVPYSLSSTGNLFFRHGYDSVLAKINSFALTNSYRVGLSFSTTNTTQEGLVQRLNILPDGKINFGAGADGYYFPTSDGTNKYVLTTNGSGNLSWAGTIASINGSSSSAQTIVGGTGITVVNSGTGGYIHTISTSHNATGPGLVSTSESYGHLNYNSQSIYGTKSFESGIVKISQPYGSSSLNKITFWHGYNDIVTEIRSTTRDGFAYHQNLGFFTRETTSEGLVERFRISYDGKLYAIKSPSTDTASSPVLVRTSTGEIRQSTQTTASNNYASSVSFNTSTGDLTIGRLGLSSLVENLDGRYSLGEGGFDTAGSGLVGVGTTVSLVTPVSVTGSSTNSNGGGSAGHSHALTAYPNDIIDSFNSITISGTYNWTLTSTASNTYDSSLVSGAVTINVVACSSGMSGMMRLNTGTSTSTLTLKYNSATTSVYIDSGANLTLSTSSVYFLTFVQAGGNYIFNLAKYKTQ